MDFYSVTIRVIKQKRREYHMLMIGNGRLVTRDAEQPFFENGAVVIDGTTVKKVGDLETLKKEFPDAEFVDAKGGAVSYTHLTLPTKLEV